VEIPAKPGVSESGLYVTVGPLILSNGKQIADFATKGKLPSIHTSRAGIDAGGLMYRGDGSQSKLFSLLHPPNEQIDVLRECVYSKPTFRPER